MGLTLRGIITSKADYVFTFPTKLHSFGLFLKAIIQLTKLKPKAFTCNTIPIGITSQFSLADTAAKGNHPENAILYFYNVPYLK